MYAETTIDSVPPIPDGSHSHFTGEARKMATEENGVAPFPLSAVDQEHLMTTDDDYKYHTWEDLKTIIGKFTHLHCLVQD